MKRLKGINRDTNPMDQPAGTYRYAKNVIVDIEKLCVTSEEGDEQKVQRSSRAIVGYIVLSDDRLVLFLCDDIVSPTFSEISIYNPITSDYSVLFNDIACSSDNKLNLNVKFPIEGEYKIDATDETTVYFTDDNNPPRFMSIDNPPIASANLDIQTTFNLFPTLSRYPKVLLNKVSAGGTLNAGTYYVTCQLVTTDGATTNFLDVSNPIYITDIPESEATIPFGPGQNYNSVNYAGAAPQTTSGKKIVVDVFNIDSTNYSRLRPIIIQKIAGVLNAIALPDIPLGQINTANASTVVINYTGFESTSTVNLAEIQLPRASYSKAKTIAQVDDVLYLGNVVKNKVDLGYQKYANSIEIHSQQLNSNGLEGSAPNYAHSNSNSQNLEPFPNITKSTSYGWSFGRSAFDNYYFKGYQRDEVYAFYITWILKDGSESVAYHIPGRPKVSNSMANQRDEDQRVSTSNSGSSYIGTLGHYNSIYGANTPFMFQLTTEGANQPGGRGMGFWQNTSSSQVYPTGEDFQVWTVDAGGNSVQIPGASIEGQQIRHHHFPAESTVNPQLRGSTRFPQGGGMIWDGGNHQGTGISFVNFNPLGFKASNIPFPEEIKDLVLGYKIYYANRSSENATVLDQGLVHNTGSNNEEGESIRYATPLSHLAKLDSNPNSLVFDGFHSLNTGDSIESASLFKTSRVQTIGGARETTAPLTNIPATQSFAKGVSMFGTNSTGNSIASTRSARFSIDWTRCRPADFNGRSHVLPYGDAGSQSETDIGRYNSTDGLYGTATSTNNVVQYYPIRSLSYLQAGGINATTFSGITVDNDRGTQTIHMQLYGDDTGNPYCLQSYGNFFNDTQSANPYSTDTFANFHNIGIDTTDNNYGLDVLESDMSTGAVNQAKGVVTAGVFGNLYALRDDVYVDFTDQTDLVYTGYFEDTVGLPAQTLNTSTIMGGDTFLGMIGISKRSTFDNMNVDGAIGNNSGMLVGFSDNNVSPSLSNADVFFLHCTHIFPTESRSHIALRSFEIDDTSSYYFPRVPTNHNELINHAEEYLRDYAFNDDYNSENNIKLINIFDTNNPILSLEDFPTRIIRSVKFNQSGMTDNFRVFLSGQFRDLPRHRGELWRLEAIRSLLLPHMEKSLMSTQGKEQLSVGAVAAALGSGDLFERDPIEVITTERGEGGTRSQWGGVVSRNGYFYVDTSSFKVYLYTGKELEEVSKYGLNNWFRDNLVNHLTEYGVPENIDIPTLGMGISSGYDPIHNRYILTYKYLTLTNTAAASTFKTIHQNGGLTWNKDTRQFDVTGGTTYDLADSSIFKSNYWTVSYYPALKAWGSFHDYNPELYAYTSKNIYKLYTDTDNEYPNTGSSLHILTPDLTKTTSAATFRVTDNNSNNTGGYAARDIEFEFIDNISPVDNKIYSGINWVVDVESRADGDTFSYENQKWLHEAGFTNLYVYNSYQMSRETPITVLPNSLSGNCRRLERGWQFNEFRDDSALSTTTAGTIVSSQTQDMFIYNGMDISQNVSFLDLNKQFHTRKKFVDRYLGVRLLDKSSASDRNFISLYLADTSKRKSYR